jgi:fatty acid desaturase
MTTQLPTPAPLPVSAPQEPAPTGRPLLAVVAAALLAIGFLGAITALVVWLADRQNIGPEVALSLQFVAAAVLLILVICVLVIVFQRLGLVDSSRAMGLPDGSIRAIFVITEP